MADAVETLETSRTIADLAARAARDHGSKSAIRHKRDGQWVELSFDELGRSSRSWRSA